MNVDKSYLFDAIVRVIIIILRLLKCQQMSPSLFEYLLL